MPPRRARASSVSSETPRRSSRKSLPPPPVTAPKNPSTSTPSSKSKKKVVAAKKGRKSAIQEEESEEELTEESEEEEEEEEEEESGDEATTSRGSKKRKATVKKTVAKKGVNGGDSKNKKVKTEKKQPRTIKPKPRRAPISGLNSIPTRFSLFPLHSAFEHQFDIPTLPEPKEAPRTIFVFGTGDMGQHGLGTDTLDEIKRPRRHASVQAKIDQEEKGWEGGVSELVTGGMHTLAIDGEGQVWSWGINDNAALGRLTSKPDIEAEELEANLYPVEGLTGPNEEEFKAVRVAAGDSVSLAVSEQGEVKAWGSFRSAEGLLGFDGTADSSLTQLHPTSLKNLDKHTIVQIACGDDHFLALTSTGYVFACGNGEQNQLGRKIVQRHKTHGLTPERLALKNIVLVGSGSYHSFAVDKDGRVFAWGSNSFHQTGVADEDGGYSEVIATPTIVSALSPDQHDGARVVEIAGGAHHSLFLLSNGQVWAVGRTDGHEVGIADDHPEMKANEERKQVARQERSEREKEELSKRFDGDGNVTVENEETGELLTKEQAEFEAHEAAAKGVPLPNDYVLVPTRLEFPKEPKTNDSSFKADDFDEDTETEETKIVSIAAGTRHNFAVSSRGYVYSWGVGASSQLGQGNEEEIETPTRIWNTALSNVRVLKAETGGQHSVVVGIDRDWEEKMKKKEEEKKNKVVEEEKKGDEEEKQDGEKEKKEDDKMEVDGQEPVVENGVASTEEGEGEGEKKSE